jgi:hypothetical protein
MTNIKNIICLVALAMLSNILGAQEIKIDNNDYHMYGPNSTWGEYLKVGGNGRGTTEASVVSTNGNLHLDSQDGNATYINHYSEGKTFINPRGGNVGVGTNNPLTKLDVNGSARFGLADEGGLKISRFNSALTDVPGSTGGIQFEGPNYSHMVFDIKGNDNNDGLYVRIPSNLTSGTTVDKTAFVVKASNRVGVATNSPGTTLDVNGTARFGLATDGGIQISRFTSGLTDVPGSTGGIQFTGPNNAHVVFDIKGNDNNDGFYVRVPSTLQASPTVDKTALVVKATGRIGFGTATPAGQLSIARSGSNSGSKTWNSVNQASIDFYADTQDSYNRYMDISAVGEVSGGNGGSNIRFITNPGNSNLGVERMLIKSNGAVGIGTSSTGTHKLAVEGSIGSREVKVEATGWSDFVFNEDYKLNTLEEVEDYIQENNHLPEIPSEAEVLENGINLGEMDAKLLQKIEELTLYMIEMNKEMKSQKEEINLLKSENQKLNSELTELKRGK